jgi:hypothetical protein
MVIAYRDKKVVGFVRFSCAASGLKLRKCRTILDVSIVEPAGN